MDSVAAPNLAGIASLVWSVDPALTAPQVRHILAATTVQSGSLGGSGGYDPNFGYGLVDADAAVPGRSPSREAPTGDSTRTPGT